MPKEKKKLLIFTGAGFSNALSEKLPTTAGMYKQMHDNKTIEELKKDFQKYLAKQPDIEILAQNIKTQIDRIQKITTAIEEFNHDNKTAYTFPKCPESKDAIDQLMIARNSTVVDNWQNLLDKVIHEQFLDKLNIKTLDDSVLKKIRQFLTRMKRNNYDANIFSTNYDTSMRIVQKKSDFYLEKDKEVNIDKILNSKNYNPDYIPYFPLKGMSDWRRDKDDKQIIYESLQRSTTIAESVLMTLDHTAGFTQNPHKKFFDLFKSKLGEADCLLFIGYSFRDSSINKAIKDCLNSAIQKIVIVHKEKRNGLKVLQKSIDEAIQEEKRELIAGGFNLRDEDEIFTQNMNAIFKALKA